MTDPVAAGAVAPSAPSAAAQAPTSAAAQTPTQLDPGETRLFAHLMQGAPQVTLSAPSGLRDAAMAYAAQFNGNVKSYEEMRRSMLESIDLSDPIKTMFVMTDQAMQAHTMFAKLHISTGLASAATSLFGTLLKNQQ
ncbi:MAG: hypothetical protein KF891_16625 [Rhizobacter sp.]|nr:hypothetical protein [Rhizobacter sp.]